MADITDVLDSLASAIGAGIYPSGTSNPSATGIATKIYPGWPTQSQLDADLAAGTVHVTVYPLPTERADSIINLDSVQQSVTAAGTTLTISGNTITVAGTPTVGDVAVVSINRNTDAYAIVSGDTTQTVAAALATMIGGTVSGSMITAPAGTYQINAIVSTPGSTVQPMRRVNRQVQITVWANTPAARKSTYQLVNASLFNAARVTLPDGSRCNLSYVSSPMTDMLQKARLYRRDMIIQCSFIESQEGAAQTVATLTFGTSTASTPTATFEVLP